jgi:hypothetical protein
MAKKSPQKRDGVYRRKDRPGWWISWTDAQGRRRAEETKPDLMDARHEAGRRCDESPGFAVSDARAGPVHCPRLVVLDYPIKNLRPRQTLMPVDRDGYVATGG